jgi:hypothetical protein
MFKNKRRTKEGRLMPYYWDSFLQERTEKDKYYLHSKSIKDILEDYHKYLTEEKGFKK